MKRETFFEKFALFAARPGAPRKKQSPPFDFFSPAVEDTMKPF
jgi:hypothetical protein